MAKGASFGTTYGPLTGIFALLLWANLSSVALFLGIAFAAQLEAVRAGVPAPSSADPLTMERRADAATAAGVRSPNLGRDTPELRHAARHRAGVASPQRARQPARARRQPTAKRSLRMDAAVSVPPRRVAVIAHRKKSIGGGLDELRKLIADEGFDEPIWHEVSKSRKARKRARRTVKDGVDLVLVWGGDGMVQRCVDALAGSDAAVAVIPAGTANQLAGNLGIPTDLPEAVRDSLPRFAPAARPRQAERRTLRRDGRGRIRRPDDQ